MTSDAITHHGREHLDSLFAETEGGLGVRQCDKTEPHMRHEYDFADPIFTRLAALCRGVKPEESRKGVLTDLLRDTDVDVIETHHLDTKSVAYVERGESVFRVEVTFHGKVPNR